MARYEVEYTDTFGGEANYAWVNRATIVMPDLTHYGYDGGTNYVKVSKVFYRELMKRAKAAVGITGACGRRYDHGGTLEFRPYRSCTVLFVSHIDDRTE